MHFQDHILGHVTLAALWRPLHVNYEINPSQGSGERVDHSGHYSVCHISIDMDRFVALAIQSSYLLH